MSVIGEPRPDRWVRDTVYRLNPRPSSRKVGDLRPAWLEVWDFIVARGTTEWRVEGADVIRKIYEGGSVTEVEISRARDVLESTVTHVARQPMDTEPERLASIARREMLVSVIRLPRRADQPRMSGRVEIIRPGAQVLLDWPRVMEVWPHTQPWTRERPGTVVAVRADGRIRVRWDGTRYDRDYPARLLRLDRPGGR